MAIHTDIPTRSEIEALLRAQHPVCVSIYLKTTPITPEVEADRIAFKNAVSEAMAAVEQLDFERGADRELREALDHLHDDRTFWDYQSHSLAVFATPERVRTFRLPNHLEPSVTVDERFFVKPLLRAVTFPQAAFVLALSQNAVRLIEISAAAQAHDVEVPDMPSDAAGAVGKASIADRSPSGAIQGSEGQKVRMRQYARKVDGALRHVLVGRDQPLILAATQPLDAIFRSVNTYPHLAEQGLRGNPDTVTDEEIDHEARTVLDGIYAAELAELRSLFEARSAQGRGASEIGDVARAATFGAVDTLFVDIDAKLPGTVDPDSGAVSLDEDGDPDDAGVVDEIARRVILSSGRVLAVRSADVPGAEPVAAILRYPV